MRNADQTLHHDGPVTDDRRPGWSDAPGTTVEVIFGDMLTGGRDLETFVVPEHGMPERLDHAGKAYLKRPIGGQGRPYWYINANGREGQFHTYSALITDP
jgi:hypothetical protein